MHHTITVSIDSVADKGMSMGRVEGKTIFIPFGAPGDLLRVSVIKEKKNFSIGEIVEVLEPSPLRLAPPCPHFTRCGGCAWQHIPYDAQVEGKSTSFKGFAKTRLGLGDDVLFDPIPSATGYGYRNRVALQIKGERAGFALPSSHNIFSLERCPVTTPAIEERAKALAGLTNLCKGATRLELQEDNGGMVWGVLHGTAGEKKLWKLSQELGLGGLYLKEGKELSFLAAGGEGSMDFSRTIEGADLKFEITPGGFVQANNSINDALTAEVMALAPFFRDKSVIDLYCGAGNFTLPLSLYASEVTGIEGYRPAALDAEKNARLNGKSNITILQGSVRRELARVKADNKNPALCLLDPPRTGAAEAIKPILSMEPEIIAYVSCSPPTLFRDLKELTEGGYKVHKLLMADMFPQTAHLEAFALLAREGSESGDFLTALTKSG